MKTGIVLLTLLTTLAVSPASWAYRLGIAPSGDLLATGYTRCECSVSNVQDAGTADGTYMGYRIDSVPLPRLEIGVYTVDPPSKPTSTSVNLQYQLVKGKHNLPGITIGAWDVSSSTIGSNKGRSVFATAFEAIPVKGLPGPVKLTLGYGDQKLNGFFGGCLIPIGKNTQFVAEYTPRNACLPGGSNCTLAIGHNFTPNWRVKVASLGGQFGAGIVYINHLGKK